jgi:DNA-binding NtrC family response regulator
MPKTILIVDDDPNIREYLETLLSDNGYETLTAENGEKALEVLAANTPDLITLDIEMPEKTGPWFNRALSRHKEHANIPIIVITGHMGLKYVIPNAVGSLSKPFEQQELLDLVRDTIGS